METILKSVILFQIFLVLNEVPTNTLTISCTVHQVNSTDEAREVANAPECDLPEFSRRPFFATNDTGLFLSEMSPMGIVSKIEFKL